MTDKPTNINSPASNQTFGEVDLGADDAGLAMDKDGTPQASTKSPIPGYDEVDLGGDEAEDPIPNISAEKSNKPKAQKVRRAGMGKPPPGQKAIDQMPSDMADLGQDETVLRGDRPKRERIRREAPPVQRPPRSYKKPILIALVVLIGLGAIAGGVFGVMHYLDNAESEKQAELDALNQGSLDSLKQQAVTKGQHGS
ncbi:MAG: hypothetical protein JRF33_20875 [Deltaproteobacteria bacterium]|nr:hypothetical protein [Deltaproteobacteria bacterium]